MSQTLSYSSLDSKTDNLVGRTGCKKQLEHVDSINDLIEGGVSFDTTPTLAKAKTPSITRTVSRAHSMNVLPEGRTELEGSAYSSSENEMVETVLKKDKTGANYIMMVGKDVDHSSSEDDEPKAKQVNEDGTIRQVPAKWDMVTQFYFGSITVIGLYLLYQMQIRKR